MFLCSMDILTFPPPTETRVEQNTSPKVNARLEDQIEERLERLSAEGPGAIVRRLVELDEEWDIERMLETNASIVTLVTLGLGFLHHRNWFKVSAGVAAFLLLHAVQGWCPPIPILRRLGYRTSREINLERTALRILRGDFKNPTNDPAEALAQARMLLR